jgi:8-oxo-dGTP pyrophosphatase MutT (NUDIX family)
MSDPKSVPSTRVIIKFVDGTILLLKKSKSSSNPNKYEFPGGKVDFGVENGVNTEVARANAVREVEEETGITLDASTLVALQSYEYSFELPRRGTIYRYVYPFEANNVALSQKAVVEKYVVGRDNTEDRHSGAYFVTESELNEMYKNGQLSENSVFVFTNKE